MQSILDERLSVLVSQDRLYWQRKHDAIVRKKIFQVSCSNRMRCSALLAGLVPSGHHRHQAYFSDSFRKERSTLASASGSCVYGPPVASDTPMQWAAQTLEGLLYYLISPLLLCKAKPPQEQLILSSSLLSDDEIAKLANSSPKVDKDTYISILTGKPNCGTVARITSDAVVKCSSATSTREVLSAELVRRYTAIPVPVHERFFRGPFYDFLVQQYIPGPALLDVWHQLGWWMRLRVALTLRFYIHELRCLSSRAGTPLFPGPPSGSGGPQECTGQLFTSLPPDPFNSYREMSRWYQNRYLVMKRFYSKYTPDSAPFDDSVPLVFTHMDLHPRNIILGDDGQLWIVDWTDAGWYPSWFESASMTLFANRSEDIPSSWTAWIPFIAGSCEKPGQLPFIRAISYSLELLPDIVNLIDPELLTT